jgi:hypothetical protein
MWPWIGIVRAFNLLQSAVHSLKSGHSSRWLINPGGLIAEH